MIARFLRNRQGVTAIEYALIMALIALVIFAALIPIGEALSGIFTETSEGFEQ